MDIDLLKKRAKIIQSVRNFFDANGYLEVDTPLLSPDLIPESCLEVFETLRLPAKNSRNNKTQKYWLIPSPEIWMKKLIASNRENIYQICKSFRNCESSGRYHSPEFTMLEYYTMNAGYIDSLKITEALFDFILTNNNCADHSTFAPPFIRMTMDEAFIRFAGFSLIEAIENKTLLSQAKKLNITADEGLPDEVYYNLIFIHAVEPMLPVEKPVALLDYPAIVPCLARLNENSNRAAGTRQRWELYIKGIEIANCFSEETCPEAVKEFFISEAACKKDSSQVQHLIDEDYWKTFLPREDSCGVMRNFSDCSGVAMGLDRVIMALLGCPTIDAVLPFPMKPIC
ncbi:elongation factor P--(R)-beta-lysine ligase [Spirochaetia bacterium]|nr:elongation factor P--(R)-beta-lysine ligase [Spirochaetia bacterium]